MMTGLYQCTQVALLWGVRSQPKLNFECDHFSTGNINYYSMDFNYRDRNWLWMGMAG